MDILIEGAACGLFVGCVLCDQLRRRIPNALPIILAALFALQAVVGTLPSDWWAHVAVGVACLAAGFLFYLVGGFGAGDGKLLAVAGMWVGPGALGAFLLAMAVCALALSGVALIVRGRFLRRGLPFAWAIAPPAVLILALRIGPPVW